MSPDIGGGQGGTFSELISLEPTRRPRGPRSNFEVLLGLEDRSRSGRQLSSLPPPDNIAQR